MEEKPRVIAILADEFTKNRPLADKLREGGFRVEVVDRQQATCDSLAAFGPDIIITDADDRNVANPFHLITKIRGDERLAKAEIFYYSTSVDVKTEITLRKLKVNSYFIKSDNVAHMVDAAHTHFSDYRMAREIPVAEKMQVPEDQDTQAESVYNAPTAQARGFERSDEFKNMFADLVDDVGESPQKDEVQFDKLYDLGVSYYDKGLYDKAVEEFDKAGQSPAWRLKSLLMTGKSKKKLGEFEKAVGIFKTGYRDSPDESNKAEFLYELGDTLDSIGKMDEAYKMFAAVYQRNKEFRDVRARLVSLKSAIESRNKA